MVTDDMFRDIHYRLYAAQNTETVLDILEQAGLLHAGTLTCTDRVSCDLVADAIQALRRLSQSEYAAIQHFVLDFLVPLLNLDLPEDASIAQMRWRENLIGWLNELPPKERSSLRNQILTYVLHQLERSLTVVQPPHPDSSCWTISGIGLWTDNVASSLWSAVLALDDEHGDIALATLARLGMPGDSRGEVLRETIGRAHKRRTRGLLIAMQELADPTTIDVVRDEWLGRDGADRDWINDELSLGVLANIADVADGLAHVRPGGTEIGTGIWRALTDGPSPVFEYFRPTIYLGSYLAPACNSAEVVPSLIAQFGVELGEGDEANHRRYLLYLRLSECVRPQQLAGWSHANLSRHMEALRILEKDAQRNTESAGRFSTSASNAKEFAWQTALCWERSEVFGWFDQGVATETNPYLRRRLYELLSAFQLRPTASEVLDTIRKPLDIRSDRSGEINAYLGAVEVARSSATWEAFDALTHNGAVLNGDWLDDTAQAFAAIAVSLVREDSHEVVSALFDLLFSSLPDSNRTAAALALENLASYSLLTWTADDTYARLSPALEDESRSEYQRALVIMTLAQVVPSLPEKLEQDLVEWARMDNDMVGWISLGTLGHFGQLSRYEDLLQEKLSMQRTSSRWDLRPIGSQPHVLPTDLRRDNWFCEAIASLYRHDHIHFAPAVSSTLRRSSIRMVDSIVRVLQEMHVEGLTGPVPKRISRALIDRLRNQHSRPVTRQTLFSSTAHLIPDQFVMEPWDKIVQNWTSDTRAALADALGMAHCSPGSPTRNVIEQILMLFGDGNYSVRRAAYRALARQSPRVLQMVCAAWMSSSAVELRQRAAEAAAWLPLDVQQAADVLYAALRSDAELIVRDTALRARKERRYRAWAQDMLARLLQPKDWENATVLRLWRYGEAFIRVGYDDSFAQLRDYLTHTTIPVHVRAWLNRLLEEGEKHWHSVTEKWPQPWELWNGKFEYGTSSTIRSEAQENVASAQYITWEFGPSSNPTKQGALVLEEPTVRSLGPNESFTITLGTTNGRSIRVLGSTLLPDVYVIEVVSHTV